MYANEYVALELHRIRIQKFENRMKQKGNVINELAERLSLKKNKDQKDIDQANK
jgi:hypothetical protein